MGKSGLDARRPGERELVDAAYRCGRAVAAAGCALVTGGRADEPGDAVKKAAAAGALAGGAILVVGILRDGGEPTVEADGARLLVRSGLGDARNALNARASDALIALGGGCGTLTEVAFGARLRRPVILVDGLRPAADAATVEEAVALAREMARACPALAAPALEPDEIARALAAAAVAGTVEEAVALAAVAPIVAEFPSLPELVDAAAAFARALAALG